MQSLNGKWMLAIDPQDIGKAGLWFEKVPIEGAQDSNVPGIIQQTFPGYHGVVWYWRTFTPTEMLSPSGRYLLRFWAVDYLAEIWLNGIYVGGHEGGETPFVLDVTDAIKPGAENLLVARVLNPSNEPIDGITLKQTPHRNKVMPYVTGGSYNHGGIVQTVELLDVPPVRISDIFARPEVDNGIIHLKVTVRNDVGKVAKGSLTMSVAPATRGSTIETVSSKKDFPPGDSLHEMAIRIAEPRLWGLDDPYLYRVTVGLSVDKAGGISCDDEQSMRCGFRDFRFEDGYFRLNGHRIFLRSAHTGNHYPIGLQLPHDPELLRRDLYYAKTMGFNMVRFIAGVVAIWLLDEGDGDKVTDASGNGHDGGFKSGEPEWVDGMFGKALSFDGVDDWVEMDAPVIVDTVDFTMGCWANPGDSQKTWTNILSSHQEPPRRGISFEQIQDDVNKFGVALGDGVNWAGVGDVQLENGEWNHMVFVREGDKGIWYLDGKVDEETKLASADPVVAATSNFRIGNWVLGGREFNGMVDEAFLFNRALKENEVTSIMDRGIEKASHVFPKGKISTAWGRIKNLY